MLFVFEEFLDGEINPIPLTDAVHSLPSRHDLISAQLHGIVGILMDITENMDALASKIGRPNESTEQIPNINHSEEVPV